MRLVLAALFLIGNAWAASDAEKIRYLISSVEHMSNASFIRNGKAYDAKAAADQSERDALVNLCQMVLNTSEFLYQN